MPAISQLTRPEARLETVTEYSTKTESAVEYKYKLDGVAPLFEDPANSTTMDSKVIRQDKKLCLVWNTLIAWSGKPSLTFNQWAKDSSNI